MKKSAPRWTEIERRLRADRPGLAARQPLSPRPARGRLDAAIPDDARSAAVLMLLVEEGATWLPLMRRCVMPADRHSGQISLPGGSCEPGETVVEAALREAEEELGLDPSRVRVLGQLDPQWIPVSGFVVHPVVAVADGPRPPLVCDPVEVEAGFWVDVDALAGRPVEERPGRSGDRHFLMRGWQLEEGFLWGATAMMLAELLVLIEEA